MELAGFTDVSELLRCGVYALCKRGVVIYVGKSKSLYSRIYTHRNLASRGKGKKLPSWMPQSLKGIDFDQVFIRTCTLDDIDALEHDMINLYKPKYNMSLRNALPVTRPIELRFGDRIVVMNKPAEPIVRRV